MLQLVFGIRNSVENVAATLKRGVKNFPVTCDTQYNFQRNVVFKNCR